MHIAYVILSHKNPKHLARLISTLNHPDDYFFVHIDKKIEIQDFIESVSGVAANVIFVKNRENGRWGDLGIVKATLNAFDEVIKQNINFSQVLLLSGQDYPIKPLNEIRSFYLQNSGRSFVEYQQFPVKKLMFGGLHRIESHSFNIGKRRETYYPKKFKNNFNWKGKLLNFILGMFCMIHKKRSFPLSLKPYFGSQWWSISNETLLYIVDFVRNNPKYLKYHKYTLLPDEIFFQSIIVNSHLDKNTITNNNKRLIIWEAGISHPKIFKESDIELIKLNDNFFARKFKENSKILDIIDAEIHENK